MEWRPRQTACLTSAFALVGEQECGVRGGEEKRDQTDCGDDMGELEAGDEEDQEGRRECGEGYGAQGVRGRFLEDGDVDHGVIVVRRLIEMVYIDVERC